MIEDHFKTPEDVLRLQAWMSTPADQREALPIALEDKLARLKYAYRLLLEHLSEATVVDMMHTHYRVNLGRKYSYSTARNDVKDARRLFLDLDASYAPFLTKLLIERLLERFVAACRAKDAKMVAKLADSLGKQIDRYEQLREEQSSAAIEPVPIIALTDPTLLGLHPDPNILDTLNAITARLMGRTQHANDAEFQEVTDDAPDP